MLTIVIPVKTKNAENLVVFIEKNKAYLARYPTIVIDSGGGEPLRPYSSGYFEQDLTLWEARRLGYSFVSTEYVMNLDCDVLIPDRYIDDALALLEARARAKLACVSIFYEDVTHNRGTLEYGVSIWKTDVVKNLYDYALEKIDKQIIKVSEHVFTAVTNPFCECSYMWRKLVRAGYKIETLPVRAIHIKPHVEEVEVLA